MPAIAMAALGKLRATSRSASSRSRRCTLLFKELDRRLQVRGDIMR